MSFLAGRLAGTEGAYFLQESKHAVGRLVQKTKTKLPSSSSSSSSSPNSNPSSSSSIENEAQADILPEVMRHYLPSKIFQPLSDSSLSTASKWVLHPDHNNGFSSVSRDALNPLRGYVSLPQVTFGPKRWMLPNSENSVLASTANDMRRDKYTPIDSGKLKTAAIGLSQIAKAFAVATAIVFGGSTLMFGLAVSKLELRNSDDIRTKGRDLVQPRFDVVKEQLIPLRTWAEDMSKKWHFEREENTKERTLIKELSRKMGAKTTN
ncbi:uncharacterized protein LOC132307390 [Cornus florida]|uniref:uncharacterized protein LOC132307390 n=1 Tax=Cornus florida TaxID=4283 RepID=UPI0028A0CBB3|nr:uncharacterized protein LOC132307390 [Cornus florida]